MNTKPLLAAMCAAIALLFTACGSSTSDTGLDENGKLLPVSSEDIDYSGVYYIRSGETGEYYPLTNRGLDEDGGVTYQWFTSAYSAYIPEFNSSDDALVFISSEERPSSTSLILMEDCGFTIGTRFEAFEENNKSSVRFSDSYCPYSPIETYVNNVVSEVDNTLITEINSTAFVRSMIDEIGFIHGLEENGLYKLNFYEGTVYKNVSVRADTRFFVSSSVYSSTSYLAQKNIYYSVVLPDNLPNGYYVIPEQGMFYYNIADNVILPSGVEISDVVDSDVSVVSVDGEGQITNA